MTITITRRRAVYGAAAVALIAAAVAVAAWVNGIGSGDTAAKGGSPTTVNLGVGKGNPASLADACVPNANCDLSIGVNNPSTVTLTLNTVALNGAPSVDGDSGCELNGHLSFNQPPPAAQLPPGVSVHLLPDFVHADAGLPICAADKTWTIPVTVTAGD